MARPLINAPRATRRLRTSQTVSQRDLVATMLQALRLTKISSPAAKHRLDGLKIALEHPSTTTLITTQPETFDRIAGILDTVGAEHGQGNPENAWASLARAIRKQLPKQGYGVTRESLKALDRRGSGYGIIFDLRTGKPVASGTGGQLAATLEKLLAQDNLVLLEVTPSEAHQLLKDPAALRLAFRQRMAKKAAPPIAELNAYYPQLSFALGDDDRLIAKVKGDPSATPEEFAWSPSNPRHQATTFAAIERLNISARRYSTEVRLYMEQATAQAKTMEKELFLLDRNRMDKLKALYGPAAVQLDPGRPIVRPLFPTTNQAWATLTEHIEKTHLGAPNFQSFEILYPHRGPTRINWSTQNTPDRRTIDLQQVNLPEILLREKVGKNAANLPTEEIKRILDPHQEAHHSNAITPPPPLVQERDHFQDLKKQKEPELDRTYVPGYDQEGPVR